MFEEVNCAYKDFFRASDNDFSASTSRISLHAGYVVVPYEDRLFRTWTAQKMSNSLFISSSTYRLTVLVCAENARRRSGKLLTNEMILRAIEISLIYLNSEMDMKFPSW